MRGQKRCSYCGGFGHNRRTCPQLKKDHPEHVERREKYLAERKERRDEWKAANGRSTARRCSWCGEQGHNRKTCSHMRKEFDSIVTDTKSWRRKVKDLMKEKGYGVGAVVKIQHVEGAAQGRIRSSYEAQQIQNMVKEHGPFGVIIGYNKNILSWKTRTSQNDLVAAQGHGRYRDQANGETSFPKLNVRLDNWGTAQDVLRVMFPNGKIRSLPVGKEFANEELLSANSLHLVSPSNNHASIEKIEENISDVEVKGLLKERNHRHGSLVGKATDRAQVGHD